MNARIDFNDIYGTLASNGGNQPKFARWFTILSRRVVSSKSLRIFVAVAAGAMAAIAILASVTMLPDTQHLSGLAALAAGTGIPMAMYSLRDEIIARGVLRAAVALAAGVIAYQALSIGWGMLALSWSILFGTP